MPSCAYPGPKFFLPPQGHDDGDYSEDIFPSGNRITQKKPVVAVALSPLQNILQVRPRCVASLVPRSPSPVPSLTCRCGSWHLWLPVLAARGCRTLCRSFS